MDSEPHERTGGGEGDDRERAGDASIRNDKAFGDGDGDGPDGKVHDSGDGELGDEKEGAGVPVQMKCLTRGAAGGGDEVHKRTGDGENEELEGGRLMTEKQSETAE